MTWGYLLTVAIALTNPIVLIDTLLPRRQKILEDARQVPNIPTPARRCSCRLHWWWQNQRHSGCKRQLLTVTTNLQ